MGDLEDVLEGIEEIEDVAEEIADPEDLIEDLVEDPLKVLFALVAAVTAGFTFLLLLGVVVVVLLLSGPVRALIVLAGVTLLVTVLAVGAFLYVRTDLPSDVRRRFDEAYGRAEETPPEDARMSEQDAIDRLKDEYAKGNLDDRELEAALEDALTSDRPEAAVERHT